MSVAVSEKKSGVFGKTVLEWGHSDNHLLVRAWNAGDCRFSDFLFPEGLAKLHALWQEFLSERSKESVLALSHKDVGFKPTWFNTQTLHYNGGIWVAMGSGIRDIAPIEEELLSGCDAIFQHCFHRVRTLSAKHTLPITFQNEWRLVIVSPSVVHEGMDAILSVDRRDGYHVHFCHRSRV